MTTWRRGAVLLAGRIASTASSVETFIGRVTGEQITRVPGPAVFFTGRLEQTPPALQQLVRNTGVLHEQVILATVVIEPVPRIDPVERIELTPLDAGFYRLVIRYGFMQGPNIPSDLARCAELVLDLNQVRYFIGHVDLLAGRKLRGMAAWRDRLFVRMATNSRDATAYYQIPVGQAMKVGLQIGI
jgi:KUP system potassium uptake protein